MEEAYYGRVHSTKDGARDVNVGNVVLWRHQVTLSGITGVKVKNNGIYNPSKLHERLGSPTHVCYNT